MKYNNNSLLLSQLGILDYTNKQTLYLNNIIYQNKVIYDKFYLLNGEDARARRQVLAV